MGYGLTPYGISQGYSLTELLRVNGLVCYGGVPRVAEDRSQGYLAFSDGAQYRDKVITTGVGSDGLYTTAVVPIEPAPNGRPLGFALQGLAYLPETGVCIVAGMSSYYNDFSSVVSTVAGAAFAPSQSGMLGTPLFELGGRSDFIPVSVPSPTCGGVLQSPEGIVTTWTEYIAGTTHYTTNLYVGGAARLNLDSVFPYDSAADSKLVTCLLPSPVSGEAFVVVKNYVYRGGGVSDSTGSSLYRIRYASPASVSFVADLPETNAVYTGSPLYSETVMSGAYVRGGAGEKYLLYIGYPVQNVAQIFEYDLATNRLAGKVVQDIPYGFAYFLFQRRYLTGAGSSVLFGGGPQQSSLSRLILPSGNTSDGYTGGTGAVPEPEPCPTLPSPARCYADPDNLTRLTLVCWDAVAGAEFYRVRRDGLVVTETERLCWQDSFAGASGVGGTRSPTPAHVYSVCAVNGCGEGAAAFAAGAEKVNPSSSPLSF